MAEGGDSKPVSSKDCDDDEEKKDPKIEAIESKNETTSEWLASLFQRSVGVEDEPPREKVVSSFDLEGVAELIKSGKCKNIVTMAGAGISTSAGIPDFRSPGSGLYDNLQKYNLPNPQAIFEIDFFKENPEPFFHLAKNLWPGIFKPTPCHYFIKLLEEKNLLMRHYSQNIDTLEHVAGVPCEKLVEAHGSFHTAHCIECQHEYTKEWIKEQIFADTIPKCSQEGCEGIVKPDIVFFGERLPYHFFKCVNEDLPKCDLLIIMGTSLAVQPFASLTKKVPDECPRLYINLDNSTTQVDPMMALFGYGQDFKFGEESNYRDIYWKGTCDDGCQKLADLLGWGEELKSTIEKEHTKIESEISKAQSEIQKIKEKKSSHSTAAASSGKKAETDIF